VSGAAPTATGGTIVDGRYVLTTRVDYYTTGSCQMAAPDMVDWVICGSQWETASVGTGDDYNLDFNATVQAPNLTLEQTCSTAGSMEHWAYDATPTSLVFYVPQGNGTLVDTFAKQ
jgi:hypothetical protein